MAKDSGGVDALMTLWGRSLLLWAQRECSFKKLLGFYFNLNNSINEAHWAYLILKIVTPIKFMQPKISS